MSEVDTNQIAADFARRLRANADHAEDCKFSVANLSTLSVAECRSLAAWIDAALPAPVAVRHVGNRNDGFAGTVQGSYVTREGERGLVIQQYGTKVIHVYREKWLTEDAAPVLSIGIAALDPDLGRIKPGHVCKHGVRWPHACNECDNAALAPLSAPVDRGGGT